MRKSVKIMLAILALLFVLVTAGSLLARGWLGRARYTRDEDVRRDEDAYESEQVYESEQLTEKVLHPGDVYDLASVRQVTEAEAKNTYTLLVIGGESAGEEVGESSETAESEDAGAAQSVTVKDNTAEEKSVTEKTAEEKIVKKADGAGTEAIAKEKAETVTTAAAKKETDAVRESGFSRGDAEAVITLTINHNTGEVICYAFDTDLYVMIPDLGGGRLGNAYAVGGGPLLVQTMEENYGLRIDNYASISFRDVARILEMPAFEELDVSKDGLDVVKELVFSLGAVKGPQVASYISRLLPYVTHNLDGEQMMKLILQIPRIVPYYGVDGMIPGEVPVLELDGYLVPDAAELADYIREKFYRMSESEAETETEMEQESERV